MINLNKILTTEPTLTPSGIEGPETERNTDTFDSEYFLTQIEACIVWLMKQSQRKYMNYKWTSYGLKHIIEREIKLYIAHGSLIAAVIQLDIPYKKKEGTLEVYLPFN